MKTIRLLRILGAPLVFSLLLACQSKGPTPKEGPLPQVGSSETSGAHPGSAQDPHAGLAPSRDPHAGMAPSGDSQAGAASNGQPDASGMIDVGAVAFKLPAKWEAQPPKSSMRRAQLSATGSAGPAELVVYFFGPQGAGNADQNIDRWIGQFSNPDGSAVTNAKKTSGEVSGFKVTLVEVAGQYVGGMAASGQAAPAKSGQRLLAAIVDSAGGPYYFKFLGPDATVTENRAAFDALIASVVPAP